MQRSYVAHVWQLIEYERGWGSKPDGYVAFIKKEDGEKFVRDIYKERSNVVPDYYVNYNYLGLGVIPDKVAEKLLDGAHKVYYD